jgi:hypothetical protein
MEFYGTALLTKGAQTVWGLLPKSLSLYEFFSSSVKLKEDLIGSSSKVKSTYGERSRYEIAYRYTVQGTWPRLSCDTYAILDEIDSARSSSLVAGWFLATSLKQETWTKNINVDKFPYVFVIHQRILDNLSQLNIYYPEFSGSRPTYFRYCNNYVWGTGPWKPKMGLGINNPYLDRSAYLREFSMEPSFPSVELGFPQFRTVLKILESSLDYQNAVLKQNSKTNAEVAQNAKALSINGLAFASDILGMRETINQIVDLGKRLGTISNRSVRDIARIPADAQLIDSYVIKTTARDVAEIISAARRSYEYYQKNVVDRIYTARAVTSSTHRDILSGWSVDITVSEKVRYDSWDQATLPFMRLLQSLDFFPSFTNVWDMIPFSFVIDWIYPIQELMSEIDTDTYVSNLPIREVLYSRHTRLSRDYWPSEESIRNVTVSLYQRATSSALAEGSPFLPEPKDVSLTHIPEATALLIQQGTRFSW